MKKRKIKRKVRIKSLYPQHNTKVRKELLDAENIPVNDLYLNLSELNTINTLLGGHAVSLKAFQHFNIKPNEPITLIDIGCGGGDNLRILAEYGRKKQLNLKKH